MQFPTLSTQTEAEAIGGVMLALIFGEIEELKLLCDLKRELLKIDLVA